MKEEIFSTLCETHHFDQEWGQNCNKIIAFYLGRALWQFLMFFYIHDAFSLEVNPRRKQGRIISSMLLVCLRDLKWFARDHTLNGKAGSGCCGCPVCIIVSVVIGKSDHIILQMKTFCGLRKKF